jgi:hypothetical protein
MRNQPFIWFDYVWFIHNKSKNARMVIIFIPLYGTHVAYCVLYILFSHANLSRPFLSVIK